ncbi:hypothetical protein HN873_057962 [Arachis hypogaea]
MDMFIGGGETSSAVVEWAMAEMIKKPKMMERAQSEVRSVYGNKGYVDESELYQLTYFKCIIKETLRLHPSVSLLVPRENKVPCQIDGYRIPANSRIMINAGAIGRDPRYWIDSMDFKPERFVDNYSIEQTLSLFHLVVEEECVPGLHLLHQTWSCHLLNFFIILIGSFPMESRTRNLT